MTRVDLARLSDVASGVASGTSFPGTPADGDLFYRTDKDLLCRYRSTGTRWVCCCLHGIGNQLNMVDSFQSATTDIWRSTFVETDFDVWIEKLYCTTYVSGTNNGSNFYTIALMKNDTSFTQTSIGSFTTASDSGSTQVPHLASVGAALVASSYPSVSLAISAKTGGPGSILVMGQATYRLIVT